MDKEESIKELTSYMTVGIFLSYLIGYLVVTGFLTNHNIYNDDLLNINFLKTGIVFLLVLVPILFIIVSETDVYSEVLSKAILYVVAISLLFIEFRVIYFLILPPYLLLYYFTLKYKIRYGKIIWTFNIIALIGPIILALSYNFLWNLYLLIVLTFIFTFVILLLFRIKKFGFGYFIAHLFWGCIIAYYFGTHIYANLPYSFKGGYSGSTLIICKEESKVYLNNIGFSFNETTFEDTVEILYSSNDKFLISKGKNESYFLSKSLFNGFKRINNGKKE